MSRSQVGQLPKYHARMELLAVQALADERAQQHARLLAGLGALELVGSEIQESLPADAELGRGISRRHRTAIGLVRVAPVGVDRRPARGLALKQRSIPELGEKPLLEAPQDRRLLAARGQRAQRFGIEVEERF